MSRPSGSTGAQPSAALAGVLRVELKCVSHRVAKDPTSHLYAERREASPHEPKQVICHRNAILIGMQLMHRKRLDVPFRARVARARIILILYAYHKPHIPPQMQIALPLPLCQRAARHHLHPAQSLKRECQ
eukprot:CAMPEP_0114153986 /NCGR_PEP_ID=MMETSP0043_2-20121206/24657_1 /TAXON_ID=464988 /ORGANISM="Hemiselmis andersenii, Strain CCMP644" /LENGTH=130 /DNA_ID=CAMNT_0001249077 /DNA_START=85 /DNA_END=475 /DNA_ORIENTATION=-